MKRSSLILFGLVALVLALVCYELFGSSGGSDEAPRCGDGRLNALNEQCDDGNDNEMDGCNNKCQRTKDLCGNGVVEPPLEECDDGNKKSGDGCSKNCLKEKKYGRCGNGRVEGEEECDDANSNDLDGCDSLCRKTVIAGGAVPELCGNGKLDEGEECDDGNNANGDGCSRDCLTTQMGPWYSEKCNACMEEKCKERSDSCKNDRRCIESTRCFLDNACMSPTVGPMSCYCGSQGVMACTKPDNDPAGPCVDEVEAGLGANNKQEVFDNYTDQSRPMGRANLTMVCLTRKCKEVCPFFFGGDPNVL